MRGSSALSAAFLLLMGAPFAGACGSADSATDIPGGDGCGRIVEDGGDMIPNPPDGASLCPMGACNYQSQEGCAAGTACRPVLNASNADHAVLSTGRHARPRRDVRDLERLHRRVRLCRRGNAESFAAAATGPSRRAIQARDASATGRFWWAALPSPRVRTFATRRAATSSRPTSARVIGTARSSIPRDDGVRPVEPPAAGRPMLTPPKSAGEG